MLIEMLQKYFLTYTTIDMAAFDQIKLLHFKKIHTLYSVALLILKRIKFAK